MRLLLRWQRKPWLDTVEPVGRSKSETEFHAANLTRRAGGFAAVDFLAEASRYSWLMKIVSFLFVAYVGYALGRCDLRVRPALTAVTVLVAMILHGLVQLALPHDEIEQIARASAWSLSREAALVAIALIETAGMWIPAMMVRWAALQTRLWASAYLMGAATLGAFTFYQPFDAHDDPHPPYEMLLVVSLTVAIVPFLIGLIAKRRQRTAAPQVLPMSSE